MEKPGTIVSFIGLYLVAIFFSYLINQWFFAGVFLTGSQALLSATAQFSLVPFDFTNDHLSTSFLAYSLVCTQLAGTMWLTILLWCYRQIFKKPDSQSLKDALFLTLKVSLIIEGLMLLYFLYGIPGNDPNIGFSKKFLAALTLSVNSFHNAGLGHIEQLLSEDVLHSGFVLQLGIIIGSILGSLGIFVIDELFSPSHLRHRLAHPETDWSFITKISVFGAAGILTICSLLFFIEEQQFGLKNINLMEALIASTMEVCSARGFGFHLVEDIGNSSKVILLFANTFGAGPFSTGGGMSLLVIPALAYLIMQKKYYGNRNLQRSYLLVKYLAIYSIAILLLVTIAMYSLNENHKIYEVLYRQWMIFSSNRFIWSEEATEYWSNIADATTIIAGRISFIVACFLTLKRK
jgi:hypothetical protein